MKLKNLFDFETPVTKPGPLHYRIEDFNEGQRAREVISRSNHKHVVRMSSPKNRRSVELESLLEYHFARQMEVCHWVKSYQEQPFRLSMVIDGKWVTTYPDFLLSSTTGERELIQVKPKKKAQLPEIQKIFCMQRRVAEAENWRFRVITEEDLNRGALAKNVDYLFRLRRRRVYEPMVLERTLDALKGKPSDVAALLPKVSGLSEEQLHIYVAYGFLDTDLALPLTLATVMAAVKREAHNALH